MIHGRPAADAVPSAWRPSLSSCLPPLLLPLPPPSMAPVMTEPPPPQGSASLTGGSHICPVFIFLIDLLSPCRDFISILFTAVSLQQCSSTGGAQGLGLASCVSPTVPCGDNGLLLRMMHGELAGLLGGLQVPGGMAFEGD